MVNSAITTIMENKAGEMILISRPMLRTTNSIRPRVFMSKPQCGPGARGHARQTRRQHRAAQLPADRYQDDQAAVAPHRGAVQQSDAGAESSERKENRK